MKQIRRFYKKIISIGIDDSLSLNERLSAELLNSMILISIPFIFVHTAYNFFTLNSIQSYASIFLWFIIIAISGVLNYLGKFQKARVFLLSMGFVFSFIILVVFGPSIRIESIFLVYVIVVNLVFKGKIACFATALVLLLYLFAVFLGNSNSFEHIAITPFSLFFYGFIAILLLSRKVIRENSIYHKNSQLQNIKLDNAHKELERFTYIASHDLKSPVRNIVSFVDLIENKIKEKNVDESLELLSFVKSNAKQMSLLVNDLLEFSRIDHSVEHKNKTLVDLNLAIEKVKDRMGAEISSANAIIKCGKISKYYCNQRNISTLFQNLIENGLKYNSSEQPIIEIFETKEDGYLIINFKDNGIGVEEEYHEQIFEFFKRLHSTEQYSGTGIGLGVCKKIVDNLGGELTVSSTLGNGSTFSVHLPLMKF